MRPIRLFLCLMFLLAAPVTAQEGYPLPEDLQPIIPDNAAQIQELARIGGILPSRLVWSPDGTLLAVGTSVDVRLYDASNFETPSLVIPDYGDITFNVDGELVVNGQRWDTQTGQLLGAYERPPAPPILSPSGDIEVQVSEEDGQPVIELRKANGDVTLLHLDGDYDVNQIVFSPDEQYAALVLTSYSDGYPYLVVQLWNVEEGAFIADLPQTLEILDTIAFHADGALLVTAVRTDAMYGGPFDEVVIYDGRTGARVGPSNYGYMPVVFSPDGELMAIGGWSITLWSDHELGVLFDPRESEASGLSNPLFSPDSRTLVTSAYGGRILIWDISAASLPDEPRLVLQAEEEISDLVFSPDGSLLVSVESGGIIEVWDMQTSALHTPLSGADYLYDVQFSPGGRLLRAQEYGGHRVIWDVQTGERKLTLPSAVVLNADWSRAAYWDNNIVRVANTNTGQETELTVIADYLGGVAAFSPTAERVIFTGVELRMYDLQTGEQVFSEPIAERAPWVEFHASGERFITGVSPVVYGRGDPLMLNIRDTREPQTALTRLEIPNGGRGWLLSPDGQYLSYLDGACGDGGGGSHQLWDAETGRELSIWRPGECGPYNHVFSRDGQLLVVGWDYYIAILDIDTLVEEASSAEYHYLQVPRREGGVFYYPGNQIQQITLSPDGSRLALSIAAYPHYGDGEPETSYRVDVFELSDLIAQMDNQTIVETAVIVPDAQHVTFSPDSHWLLTDTGFWNAATGEQLADVASAIGAFSADGMILATVTDTGVALWDVSALAQGSASPVARLDIQDVVELAFNPDGTLLFVRDTSGVSVWGIP